MSSFTNGWPTYAAVISLGLLVFVLGLFFIKVLVKKSARLVGRVALPSLGIIALMIIAAASFLIANSQTQKKGKQKKPVQQNIAPARSAPDKNAPSEVSMGYRPPLCQELHGADNRVFDYYCPHGTVRIWVALKRIDPVLAEYVVMLEDDKFYQHGGLDADGIFNALEKDFKAGKFVRGGSTITQQLAKNLFLTKEKSIMRKIEEVPIALRLEKELSKRQILELYLNTIEWGPGVHGIEAACRLYFDHDSSELTEPERWLMALMIPNPKELNLWAQPRGRKSLLKRAKNFSQRLKYEKHITEAERQIQMQTFSNFLDQWALKKPTSTWMENRHYPASWFYTSSLMNIPVLKQFMKNKNNATRSLTLNWALQSRLNALVPKASPSSSAVVLISKKNTAAMNAIEALGFWPSGKPPTDEIKTLAHDNDSIVEVLPLHTLRAEWFFAR